MRFVFGDSAGVQEGSTSVLRVRASNVIIDYL